jgi:PKHD-type hydroxylase
LVGISIMSIYQILPNAPRAESIVPFTTWEGAFSDEEVEKIIQLCETLEKTEAKVGSGEQGVVNPEVRKTTVSWLKNSEDASWIYDRIAYVGRRLNSKFYRFNLYGFIEDIQYTVYEENNEGHYDWHIDIGPDNECARKLSLVIQLSDPSEYEGGELEILRSSTPERVLKQRGLAAGFPSYTLHRVTPVTKGTRRTLVIWLAGPDFV